MRILALLLLALVTSVLVVLADARRLLSAPLPLSEATRIEIAPGTAMGATLEHLRERQVLIAPRLTIYLRAYARLHGLSHAVKAGEYELKPGLSALDVLLLLVSGKTVLHELRLLEGWSFEQALLAVRAHPAIAQTLRDLDARAVMTALGEPDLHPEGRLFPDTYHFPKGTTDLAFLRRAKAAMDHALAEAWAARAPELPLANAEEALILASIIEKETGIAAERRQVAGVFINRLRKGMRLQTDPTVIYGLGQDYQGRLRRADLRRDTPYNTYTRHGLPPTPICLPGAAALQAAVNPLATSALFFVAVGDGSGAHVFSDTLDAHNAAVKRYLENLRSSR